MSIENTSFPNISYREFVLGKLVGSGAIGKVYRARLQSDGQERIVSTDFVFATRPHMPRNDPLALELSASPGGTLGYAAPEQILQAWESFSFGSDVSAGSGPGNWAPLTSGFAPSLF